jgi:hypothetical protein
MSVASNRTGGCPSTKEEQNALWEEMYSIQCNDKILSLLKYHVRRNALPASGYVYIYDLFDSQLKDTFVHRMGYPLMWLRVDAESVRKVLLENDLETLIEAIAEKRHPWITGNCVGLKSLVNSLTFTNPCDKREKTHEILVKELASIDAHELLVLLLSQAIRLPDMEVDDSDDSDDNDDDDEDDDCVLLDLCDALAENTEGVDPNIEVLFTGLRNNHIAVNEDDEGCYPIVQRCPTDMFGIRFLNDKVQASKSNSERSKWFNNLCAWLNELYKRGVDLGSVSLDGNPYLWLPIVHYFWNQCFGSNCHTPTFMSQLCKKVSDLSFCVQDTYGQSILHKAAFHGDIETFGALIFIMSPILEIGDEYNETPIHVLARYATKYSDIMELLRYKVVMRGDLTKSNVDGDVPLSIALMRPDISAAGIVEAFIALHQHCQQMDETDVKQCAHQIVRHGAPLKHLQLLLRHFPRIQQYLVYRFSMQANATVLEMCMRMRRIDMIWFLANGYPSCLTAIPVDDDSDFFDRLDATKEGMVSVSLCPVEAKESGVFQIMRDTDLGFGIKLLVLRRTLEQSQAATPSKTIEYLQACLQLLIDKNDFETLYQLFLDTDLPAVYKQETSVSLADYRTIPGLKTFFHMIAERATDSTSRTIKNHMAFQLLYVICENGSNPFSCSQEGCSDLSLLPSSVHADFERFRSNTTLEGLIKEYHKVYNTQETLDKAKHFEDPITLQLMRYPVYCVEDKYTYDYDSICKSLEHSRVLPISRKQLLSDPTLRPNLSMIRDMRNWLESIIWNDTTNTTLSNAKDTQSETLTTNTSTNRESTRLTRLTKRQRKK